MTFSFFRQIAAAAVIGALLFIPVACDSSNPEEEIPPAPIDWNYGTRGPSVWATLSSDFALCGSGMAQSPVDITVDPIQDWPEWTFSYGSSPIDAIFTDHSIRIRQNPGSTITVDGVVFTLKYFKIKTPGEHSVDGETGAGELQFFHENANGDIAVVAVRVEIGEENKNLAPLLEVLPAEDGATFKDPLIRVRPIDFLPAVRAFYRYAGSLTEPPCTEGVDWIVLRDPIIFSAAQIGFLNDITRDNNRPLQPLNGRAISQR